MRYYDIKEDLEKYPKAWAYLIWSRRGPGKTYSTLRYMLEHKKKFVFIKRTNKDVDLLCAGNSKKTSAEYVNPDFSPFAPLNRDFGYNILPYKFFDGVGAFYDTITGDDGKAHPTGEPIGFILSASNGTNFKGFDISQAEYMIFDEFIPKPWDRISRKEGDSILDMYETISRDRVKRGRGELKFIALANATMLNNPLFNTLRITDDAAEMDIYNIEYKYNEYRGIMLHYINWEEEESGEDTRTGIQRAMEGTKWGAMAYGGHFAYNDFSTISKNNLKRMSCVAAFKHEGETFYIYRGNGKYHVTRSRQKCPRVYDLSIEYQQKKFYYEYVIDIRDSIIEGNATFESFVMYDIFNNYKDYFKIY